MNASALFGISILGSFTSSAVAARLFVWPWLRRTESNRALTALVAPHMFLRFIGLSFLVPGVVSPLLPAGFAVPAAYGDFVAGVLAIVATAALANRARWAGASVWLFNIWGAADLLFAFYQGNRVGLQPGMLGPAFYLVTALVPALLVTHLLLFGLLVRRQAATEPNHSQRLEHVELRSRAARSPLPSSRRLAMKQLTIQVPSAANDDLPSARGWFAGGERVGYDANARALVPAHGAPLNVFLRREGDLANAVSFLPGFPDGSFGWAKVLPYLPNAAQMSKLFVEYVGMGDSDKPKDYAYSTAERTDLVEAIWRDLGVQSTVLVAFDFSSLVVLEHLRRRLERSKRGEPAGGPEIRGVIIFNGGLFPDGHSHPWYTTPLLRRLPKRARAGLARSFSVFKMTAGVMWSKGYKVKDEEVREVYNAINRRDGGFYLAAAAGFAAEHKAQGDRLDFGRLFEAYGARFPFLVGGSEEDPFEHRQVDLAENRLGKLGLQIKRLPGGHLTTHEQPKALAALIANFERGLLQEEADCYRSHS